MHDLIENLKKHIQINSHAQKIQFIREEIITKRYEINSQLIAQHLLEYSEKIKAKPELPVTA
jgi:hypothetical protein